MSQLFTTAYPNNIRQVIAGDPVSQAVFRDDVILECNTAGAGLPFTINLLEIPANYWNTTYKLYVSDIGNNASVRNITINAPSGQTINELPSIVISTNGGGVIIRILDNGKYIATFNTVATGFYQIVQDEGVSLPQRLKLNFTGAGVTASDDAINNATVVNISGLNLTSLTNAALQALITGGTIQAGSFYQVTDPINAVSVIVQGIGASSVTTLQGSGVFLNADYQAVGNYSGVAGYAGNIGIWETAVYPLGVVVGNVVIWNNLHYVNLTGAWGTAPNTDAVNWAVLPKSKTNGYIEAVDFIKYDVLTNRVIYRADKLSNEVEDIFNLGQNSLDAFQWGRNAVEYNKVLSGGIIVAPNTNANFSYNQVTSFGALFNASTRNNAGSFIGNIITQAASVTITDHHGSFGNNYISESSTFNIAYTESTTIITHNTITEQSQVSFGNFMGISTFVWNKISQTSSITVASVVAGCAFQKLNMSNVGSLIFNSPNINGIVFSGCEISDNNTVNLNNVSRVFVDRKIRKDFSNWEETLDLDSGIFAAGVLTIDPLFSHVGVFTLVNSTAKTISQIVNQPTNHKYVIKPDAGQSVSMQHTLVGVAVAGNMVCDAPAALNLLTGRVNGCDFIEYAKSGDLCLRNNMVLLA